jgi:CheY-like chemotaxis protein
MKDLLNETVLVIDDDETTRGTLRMLLEFEDLVVACCEDGISGLDLAKKEHFDVILVDYQMPGLKGDDTTRLLRALCTDAFIIGMSIESKELEFTKAGSNAFINKERLVQDLPQLARRKLLQ